MCRLLAATGIIAGYVPLNLIIKTRTLKEKENISSNDF